VRFLIDACLPREFSPAIATHGHVAFDVRDIGMGSADDPVIAAYSLTCAHCLLTEDWGFADIRRYPPADYFGIVVFETADGGTAEKLALLDALLSRADIVNALPGRLAIVSRTRIRLRPPL
jgi:predicted nuclease of predicted toxin-antitoxin system